MNITQSNPTKQLSLSILVAIACLLLSLYFPASSAFEKITRSVFFLLVIPFFYIKTVLKKNLSDFGFNLKNKASGPLWATGALAGIIFSFYLIQKNFGLENISSLPAAAIADFSWFVFYELVFVSVSLFCLEFFFRGFLLFSLLPRFSLWAIFFQAGAYIGLSLLSGASIEIFLQSLAIAAFSGLLAWKTRSFLYSYGIMLLASIMIDAWIIRAIK